MQFSPFLRAVLALDGAACLAIAAAVAPFAQGLQQPLGVDSALLGAAALSLIPIGLFILWLGSRKQAPAALVWLVIVGNVGWAVASLAAAGGIPAITGLGALLVGGQGLAVLAMAAAEYFGLRASSAHQAKPA